MAPLRGSELGSLAFANYPSSPPFNFRFISQFEINRNLKLYIFLFLVQLALRLGCGMLRAAKLSKIGLTDHADLCYTLV